MRIRGSLYSLKECCVDALPDRQRRMALRGKLGLFTFLTVRKFYATRQWGCEISDDNTEAELPSWHLVDFIPFGRFIEILRLEAWWDGGNHKWLEKYVKIFVKKWKPRLIIYEGLNRQWDLEEYARVVLRKQVVYCLLSFP